MELHLHRAAFGLLLLCRRRPRRARPRPCQEHRRRKPPGESSQHGSKGSGTILEIEAERGDASRGRCQPGPPPTDSMIGGPCGNVKASPPPQRNVCRRPDSFRRLFPAQRNACVNPL